MTIRPALPAFAAALLVLLWPFSPAPAIERATRDASDILKRADQLLKDGKLDEAVEAYSEAVAADPHNWKALYSRASVYRQLHLPDLAEADTDHAVAAAPRSAGPLLARGVGRFNAKRYAEAIKDFDAAIRLEPENTDLYHWRGCAYAQSDQCDKAIADFTKVIEHDPEQTGYHGMELYNRAIAEHTIGRLEDALNDYEQAEKAGQSTTNARAECLMDLKRWKEAEEIFNEVLRTTEEDGEENQKTRYDALRNRAVALAGQKLYDRSEADLTDAIALKPDNLYAYGTASWTRLFAGKVEEARDAGLKALSIDGDQLWVHLNLAHAYLLGGHFDWAKSIYVQDKDKRGSWGRNGVQIALQDLADLREAGVTSPELARGEAFLKGLLPAPAAPSASPSPSPSPTPAE